MKQRLACLSRFKRRTIVLSTLLIVGLSPAITYAAGDVDLTITKSGPGTATVGQNITYGFTVTQLDTGNSTGTSTDVTDLIPAGFTFVSATASCGVVGSSVVCTGIPDLAQNQSHSFSITFNVTAAACNASPVQNTATVDANETDTNPSNDTSNTVTTTIPCDADVSVTKTGNATVNGGDTLSYTVTVSNGGPGETLIYTIPVTNTSTADATNIVVTDTLPSWLNFVSADNGGTHSNGIVTWSGLNINGGQTVNLMITVTINQSTPGGTQITNTAQVLGGPSATDTTLVNGGQSYGCIEVYKEAFNVNGQPMTPVPQEFTFILDNGPSLMTDSNGYAKFDNVSLGFHNVFEIIPRHWILFSVNPPNGVNVLPGPTCATVTFKNQQQRPNNPDLTITKTDNRTTVGPGETLVYTIVVRNTSNVDALDVSVGDLLPYQTTYISSSDNGSLELPLVIWRDIFIPAGGQKQLTLTVKVNDDAQIGSEVFNMAQIHHGETAVDSTLVVGIQQFGCVDVVKEAFDINGSLINPVPQFTFNLDGGAQTTVSDSLGTARFNNVPAGTHTVSEIIPATWKQLSITPPNGLVIVSNSPTYSTVLFKNQQDLGGADFLLHKTDGRSTVTPGENLTYTITVENITPANATGVTVIDTLPSNVTFVSADNGGIHSNGVVTWSSLSVNANSNKTLTVTVNVNSATPNNTVLTNSVSIPNKASTIDTTTVSSQQANFTISKTDNLTTANPGQALTYTITIQNVSAFNATSVTVTDTLPSPLIYNSSSDSGTINGQLVTWTGLSIAAGAQKQLTVTATVNSSAQGNTIMTNTAQIQNGPSATDTTTISGSQPVLTITKTDNRTTAEPGETLTYVITIQNTSATNAAGVVVQDILPASTTFVSATNNGVINGQIVTWSNLTVNGNSTLTLTVQVSIGSTAIAGTVLTNVAQIAAGLSATDTTTIQGGTPNPNNITLDLTDDRDPVEPGESFCYTLRITNLNASELTGQTVTQTIDSDTEYQSSSQGGSHNSSIITWNNITLPGNGTKTLNSCVKVDEDTEFDEVLSSQAFINNQTDTETTRVDDDDIIDGNRRCEIQSVSDTPDPATPGETITYSIRIRNGRSTNSNSSSSRTNAYDIIAFIDNDLEFVSASDGGDVDGDREVEWNDLRLRRGESDSVRLTVRVKDTVRDDRVRVRIQCEDDEEYENTRIEEGDKPPSEGRVRVSIDKRASKQEAKPGDLVTYTVTLRNLTDREAKDVTVEDRFNAGSISIQDAGGGDVIGNGIDWEIPTLGANDTRIFTYRVRVGPDMRHGQIISNTVIARSPDLDRPATDIEEVRILTELPQTGSNGFFRSFKDTTQNLRPTTRTTTVQAPNNAAAIQFIVWTSIISLGIIGGSVMGKRMFL